MLNDDPLDGTSLPIKFCNAYKNCNLLQLHQYSAKIFNAVIRHASEIFLYPQQDKFICHWFMMKSEKQLAIMTLTIYHSRENHYATFATKKHGRKSKTLPVEL